MKTNIKLALILAGLLISACGKKEESQPAPELQTPPPVESAPPAQQQVVVIPKPPLAHSMQLTLSEDSSWDGSLQAESQEGLELSYEIVEQPLHGMLENFDSSMGSIRYVPVANYSGLDSFKFRVKEGELESEVATVSLSVGAINDAPLANAGSYQSTEDNFVNASMSGQDPDNDSLSFDVVTLPLHGNLNYSAQTGEFSYTPNAQWSGSDSFTFRVKDAELYSDAKTVSLSITAVNDAPVALPFIGSMNSGETYSYNANAQDVENGQLTFELLDEATLGSASMSSSGEFTYVAFVDSVGTETLHYRVSDGASYSETVTITMRIINQMSGSWTAYDVLRGATSCEDATMQITKADGQLTISRHGYHCGFSTYYFEGEYVYNAAGEVLLGTAVIGHIRPTEIDIDYAIFGFRMAFRILLQPGGSYRFEERSGNGFFSGNIRKN